MLTKKTKIICTMGPATDDDEVLKDLMRSGMDIARLNFSHGDHEEQLGRIKRIKKFREELNLPIAILLDTKGPEIRTGLLETDDDVELVTGQEYTLTTRDIKGNNEITSITYAELPQDVEAGNTILIDDGLIELKVKEIKDGTDIVCDVINGGLLGSRKGVNVPNVRVNLPSITEKDKADIEFGLENGIDFIAASFIRNAEAVEEIKDIIGAHNMHVGVISKIENMEGVENIDAIIDASAGIMVARGDLGVEVPAEEVPFLQKEIIRKCNDAFKPVVTATQMLDSMIRNPRPTRAEATDVANAIYDGTDAIMLSGETAKGKYPVVLDLDANVIENESGLRPTSESLMHLQIYKTRPDVNAICHTHSMYATTFAVLNKPIPAVVYEIANLGVTKSRIPVAPYGRPGTTDLSDSVIEPVQEADVFLLQGHGAVAVSQGNIYDAYLRAAYIEELAQLYYNALCAGQGEEPYFFPPEELQKWEYPSQIKFPNK